MQDIKILSLIILFWGILISDIVYVNVLCDMDIINTYESIGSRFFGYLIKYLSLTSMVPGEFEKDKATRYYEKI